MVAGTDPWSKHAALVPKGAAHFPVDKPGPTRDFAFILVPGFTLLAFSSAVEPLRIANQLSQRPLYSWRILSETGAPVASSSGIEVVSSGALEPLARETSLFVCAGNPQAAAAAPKVVAAVKRHHRFGGIVGGICTGAVALAGAGLLKSQHFTLHWENQPGFIETFPDLVPTDSRFEADGRVMTCGGGAAATDMMLSLIAANHGHELAAMVSEMCLRTVMIGSAPAQRSSIAAVMQSRNPTLIAMVKLMNSRLDEPLSMAELAEAAGCSCRQAERIFKKVAGKSPSDFYRDLRLDHGRNLLATTDLSVSEVTNACGFRSVANFTRNFRARFGAPPSKAV